MEGIINLDNNDSQLNLHSFSVQLELNELNWLLS